MVLILLLAPSSGPGEIGKSYQAAAERAAGDAIERLGHSRKVVVSVKYDNKWEGSFIDQTKRNMEQEGAAWGILVSTSFPHDALNDKVYLHRSGIIVAKPDHAA